MMQAWCASGWLLFASAWAAAGAATPVNLLHDARVTHDVAGLEAAAGRAVLRIVPAQGSGSAADPGTIGQAGTWEVLYSPAAAQAGRRGEYRWVRQMRAHERKPSWEDFYSPFTQGGVILCEFHPERSGEAQFAEVTMLPEAWVEAVRGAGGSLDAKSRSELEQTARGSNPLAASLAMRRLVAMGVATEAALTATSGFVRAVSVYLVAVHYRELPAGTAENVLRRLAGGAVDENARFTALGIVTARMAEPQMAPECPWTADILKGLAEARSSDPEFGAMLELTGIREE